MRYTFTSLLFVLVLPACVSASGILSEEQSSQIPKDANTVLIQTRVSADSLRSALRTELGRRGFGIQSADDRSITTTATPVGQETTLLIRAFVEPTESGSRATLRGSWGVSSSMATGISAGTGAAVSGDATNQAEWTSMRPKQAYAQLTKIAYALPLGTVSHERQ